MNKTNRPAQQSDRLAAQGGPLFVPPLAGADFFYFVAFILRLDTDKLKKYNVSKCE
jgi:hypothetical protein